MNEIEKLYENAKIFCLHPSGFCKHIGATCERCERHKYPPFTAEKQLGLIKWLIKEVDTLQMWYFGPRHNCYDFDLGSRNSTAETFEECIAKLINDLWQDLTSEEKEQIRSVLNGN